MEQISFRYGEETVDIAIENAKSITYLEEGDLEEITDLPAAFRRAVTVETVGSLPLGQIVDQDDLVTVVISDITRSWMHQDVVLRQLTDYLTGELGLPDGNIAILVALGTHRQHSEEELRAITSDAVYDRFAIHSHDAYANDLVSVGTTSRGTEVVVNPLAVGRKVILMGGTVHHLMSGFGGGRKSIVPGISSRQSIKQNHIMCLDPQKPCSRKEIGLAKLEGNPVHEDMMEAAAMVDPAFGINIICNSRGKHCRLICGHWDKAWRESCRVVHQAFGLPIEKKADIVIGSCGGYPKDINLYQGVKTLFNMSQAVKDGGTMLFLAECRDGGGPDDFFDWNKSLQAGTLDADLRADFTIGGYIFYAGVEAMARSDTKMLTQISPEILRDMHITASDRIDPLLEQIDFSGKDVYIMQSGGYTMPYLENRA